IGQDNGEILKEGGDISFLPPDRRNVAMVFQEIALYPHLKNIENIEFPYVLHNKQKNIDNEILHKVSEMLQIDKEKVLAKKPRLSSLGERQRVAIGKALLVLPDILLLDEPFSNIEMSLRTSIKHSLKKFLKQHNITTIYVSHNQLEMGTFADRIGVLAEKKLQQTSTYEELYNDPKTLFVALYIGEIPANYLTEEEVNQLTGGKISYYLSIRPDECYITESENSIKISGKINAIEPLIQEGKKLYFIDYNNRNFGILMPENFEKKVNEKLDIYIPLKKAKFFEKNKNTELIERIYNIW
ncbi:MAG: ABC transporter ATP-binding protein, partial [Brevinematales bacterium]|nr:ABC transporter ATP-binding protein [Brevinematales bacterium]